MKHPFMLLAVLLVGAVPFAAAAAVSDYGPNPTLLASNRGAPQLPGAQARAASTGAMPKPEGMEAASGDDDASEASPAMPRVAPMPPPPVSALPRSQGPTASSRPHSSNATQPTKPTLVPNPASWRSLLPGSIQ